MIKALRPALFLMMLAIVVISPASVYAAENITINNLPLPLAEGDFFDILPFYVWIIIAIVLLVIIVFIIFLLFGPKKKKGEQAAKGEKKGKKMPADMDKRQRPQADMGQRTQQMPPDMGQASPMPARPYNMNEAAPYPQNSPAAPQMRPPQPAGSPNMSPPQPAQPRPMQTPPPPVQGPTPSQAPTPMQQGPSPAQAPMPMQAPSPAQGPSPMQQPQRMPPQPVQGRPQPGQQPPPVGQRPAAPQPMQAQPRPVQPTPPGAAGMPPKAAPQPVQPSTGQGMPPRPRPSGTPQPAYPARQQFGGPSQMDFMVGNLTITPMRVKDGQEVSISATVTNRSGSESNYSMVFRINHVVEKITEITLGPGASQTETVKVIKENPGDYYVDVDGIRGSFTVVERAPATFTIDSLKISPERIKQGDPVAISFNITNNGERQGVYSASVNIKGISEAMEDITLEGGETKHVTFNIVKDTAGFYPVSVEHLSGRFVVEMDWKGEGL